MGTAHAVLAGATLGLVTAALAPTHAPRTRRVAVAALMTGSALLLTGCQIISPRQTDVMYAAADGVALDVGDVQLRNLVVVADTKGGPGTLSAAVANNGTEPVELMFATSATSETSVPVEVGTPLNLSVDGPKVTLPAVDAAPGDIVVVQVGDGKSGAAPVNVPVVPASGYYATFAK